MLYLALPEINSKLLRERFVVADENSFFRRYGTVFNLDSFYRALMDGTEMSKGVSWAIKVFRNDRFP